MRTLWSAQSGWKFASMVHADAVICVTVQNQSPAHIREIHKIWLSSHITAMVYNSNRATDFCQGKKRTQMSVFDQF